jgi:ADP-heptose:LPS heptosyltransferase
VARELAASRGATIVLTGGDGDRALVDEVKRGLVGVPVVDAAGGLDVPTLAGVLARLDLFVTSDTGPMHLAAAVGTPVVALFGPAQPARYGPRASVERIVRVDLPCSPCGRVRLPPERCRGHVPDCMDGITVAAVLHAANALLDRDRSIGRLASS